MVCPNRPGPLLTAPDSGQDICHGIDRYVVWISPYCGHSPTATTLHHTGQDPRLSKRATVDKQRKAGIRSRQNCVGIRSTTGVINNVQGGIMLLERGAYAY